jgi:carbonic anhydrase
MKPAELLPTERSYYYYRGSFTSPPCTEGVDWIVFRAYRTVSMRTLLTFPFKSNFRPPQPLGDRKVYVNFADSYASQHHLRWGYRHQYVWPEPKLWGAVYPRCKGKSQSPINIDPETVRNGRQRRLRFDFASAIAGSVRVINDGRIVRISGKGLNSSFITLDGNKLRLQEIRFHCGSEHTINEERLPLEAQFLLEGGQTRLMVAVLFRVTKKAQSADLSLAKLHFKELQHATQVKMKTHVLNSRLDLRGLLPKNTRQFYFYTGSGTTPPCTEGVKWVVLKNYATCSRRFVAQFPFLANFRPVQPLNGRKVDAY